MSISTYSWMDDGCQSMFRSFLLIFIIFFPNFTAILMFVLFGVCVKIKYKYFISILICPLFIYLVLDTWYLLCYQQYVRCVMFIDIFLAMLQKQRIQLFFCVTQLRLQFLFSFVERVTLQKLKRQQTIIDLVQSAKVIYLLKTIEQVKTLQNIWEARGSVNNSMPYG